MSYHSQQQHRRYLRRLAATQNQSRVMTRVQVQRRNMTALRLYYVASITATALWMLWQCIS